MGKYRAHDEFGANAPVNWREKTTSEAYLEGMSRIAPPGMKPRAQRGRHFEARTEKPESAKWHHNYDIAMFGGTEIPLPDIEPKQMALEEMLNGIERIPHVERR
jgi:hypothetical protein